MFKQTSNKFYSVIRQTCLLMVIALLPSCVVEHQAHNSSFINKSLAGATAEQSSLPPAPIKIKPVKSKQRMAAKDRNKPPIEKIPVWFLNPPKNEHVEPGLDTIDLSLFVTGTGLSSNLQIAIDKSLLAAKRNLADQLNSRLRSTVISILDDAGLNGKSYLRSTTRNLIPEVNISGYRKVKSHLIQEGTQYRSFTLIEFPLLNYNNEVVTNLSASEIPTEKLENSKKYKAMRNLRK